MNESTEGQKPNLRTGSNSLNEMKAMGAVDIELNSLQTNVADSRSSGLAVHGDGLGCHRAHARGGNSTGIYNLGRRDRYRHFCGCFRRTTIDGRAESPHIELFADCAICRVSSDVLKSEKTALVSCDPSKLLTSLSMGTTDGHIDCVCLGALVVTYRAEVWWQSVEFG